MVYVLHRNNRPDNLITLCESCHGRHHKGLLNLVARPSKGFKAETFMSMVRWRLVNETGAGYSYGYITKTNRIVLGLTKLHVNDAYVVAGGSNQARISPFMIKQVRKCNRKLFKGDRSHIRNTVPRFTKGFQRYDKVAFRGQECFVFGRRTTGYFDLRLLNGTKIHSSANVKQLKRLERANTFLIERGSVRTERIAA